MSELNPDHSMNNFEQHLRELQPASCRLDRDELMFAAGQAAAGSPAASRAGSAPAGLATSGAIPSGNLRRWQAASVLGLATSMLLACLLWQSRVDQPTQLVTDTDSAPDTRVSPQKPAPSQPNGLQNAGTLQLPVQQSESDEERPASSFLALRPDRLEEPRAKRNADRVTPQQINPRPLTLESLRPGLQALRQPPEAPIVRPTTIETLFGELL